MSLCPDCGRMDNHANSCPGHPDNYQTTRGTLSPSHPPLISIEFLQRALRQAIRFAGLSVSPDDHYIRTGATGSDRAEDYPELVAFIKESP